MEKKVYKVNFYETDANGDMCVVFTIKMGNEGFRKLLMCINGDKSFFIYEDDIVNLHAFAVINWTRLN